ncbi:MAG TPA: hypothetical protein VEQ41_04345 [Solirubrobacterales bacterium]|nr:hypothetical protein [Solirubrobacterales bacterium]
MVQRALEAAEQLERNAAPGEALTELLATREAFHERLARTLSNLPQGQVIEIPTALNEPSATTPEALGEERRRLRQAQAQRVAQGQADMVHEVAAEISKSVLEGIREIAEDLPSETRAQ